MSKKLTTEEFIERAKKTHGSKYDYSKVMYIDANTKVCIVCPEHGEFWQNPMSHLSGVGCRACGYLKNRKERVKTTGDFINQAREVHKDKYDYSKVDYKGAHEKVCIICPEHGEFWQTAYSHIQGKGCSKCSHRSYKYTTDEFVNEAKKIHGDKYDYSKVNYKNNQTKVCIICPEHGEFWQTPNKHLIGEGCPNCINSLLENKTKTILDKNNIENIQKCTNSILPWLGRQHLDFYLPEYKVAIECQGKQHFEPIEYFGGIEKFNHLKSLDKKKLELCRNNDVSLYYVNYDDNVEECVEMILEAIRN